MAPAWADVLDSQVDAWHWYTTDMGQRELRGFAESVLSKNLDPEQLGLGPEELKLALNKSFDHSYRNILTGLERLPGMLWRADPVHVDSEMMPLIRAALAGWKPEVLLETDILIPNGFMVLPEPIYLTDIHDKRMSVRSFLWERISKVKDADTGEIVPGILLAMFSDLRDDDDYSEIYHDVRARMFVKNRPTRLLLAHVVSWGLGYPAAFTAKHTGVDILQCVLRLMSQTVAVRDHRDAPRQQARRIEKAEFPPRRITVVTLRRPETRSTDPEHRTVDWSHRWIVDGHWRQQWYPSLGQHRQIWISPYVKGPTDLPLVVPKAHVYQFVR